MINTKNNDNKYFLWCHVRNLNFIKKHPERIKQKDKKLANNLNYEGIEFPISKKDYCKIKKQNNICINTFCYENGIIYPLYIAGKKFSYCMDLLLIFDENKSHYVCIKDFDRSQRLGPTGNLQGTNAKVDDLMKKLFFRFNSLCFTHLFLFFTGKNKYSKGLNGDVYGTQFRDVSGTK